MNTAALLVAALAAGFAGVLAGVLVPRRPRPAVVGTITAVAGVLGTADGAPRWSAERGRLRCRRCSRSRAWSVALTALSRQEPFPLFSIPVRLAARLPHRAFVTVTTNVPGPRQQLFALGRPLVEIIAYVPIGSTLRTGVSIFTYRDRITFGVTGDYDTAADVEVLARSIEDGLAALVGAAHAA